MLKPYKLLTSVQQFQLEYFPIETEFSDYIRKCKIFIVNTTKFSNAGFFNSRNSHVWNEKNTHGIWSTGISSSR